MTTLKLMDEVWAAGSMSEAQFAAACGLHHRAFPKPGRTLEGVMRKKRAVWMQRSWGAGEGETLVPEGGWMSMSAPRRHVVLAGEDEGSNADPNRGQADRPALLANAATLTRRIATSRGELTVRGLLDVATDPATRGQGLRLGQRVVRAAWAALEHDPSLHCCLFQTDEARGFYEKLGARVVSNRFVNKLDPVEPEASPFEEPVVMIYPAAAAWPDGEVDLRGPGW